MTKKTDAWMPLWIGAYLADTQHLSRDEHGGYLLLLMAYWRASGPLPDDDKRLAAIVKASPREWKALRPVLAEFFTVADGCWTHKRVEQELADSIDRKMKAAGKARGAAQARWKDGKPDAQSNAPSTPPPDAPSIGQAMHGSCPTPSPIASAPIGAGDGAPPNANEQVFAIGVSLLTAAGVIERNARSFLAAQVRAHEPPKVLEVLQRCAREAPIQPVPWIVAALGSPTRPVASATGRRPTSHTGLADKNYAEGVTADGTLA